MTRRLLPGGFELDDDRSRVDRAEVHRFLSGEAYWAEGRERATQDRLIAEATRVVGLYAPDGRQVGFCRAFSDGYSLAYLADVYVLSELRGRGLGAELVREMVERGPLARLKWYLHTEDAHALYAKLGFEPPGRKSLERPARPA